MNEIIRLLAKEVRRIRALINLMEEYGDSSLVHRIHYRTIELNTMKRILALSIKKA